MKIQYNTIQRILLVVLELVSLTMAWSDYESYLFLERTWDFCLELASIFLFLSLDWGTRAPTFFALPEPVQKGAPLSHNCSVSNLSFLYRYFDRFRSSELSSIKSELVNHYRNPSKCDIQ